MNQHEVAAVERGPATSRGAATRQRILDAACDLVFERGASALNLDEVLVVTRTSKSQLYHYFADKSDLIRAVVARQGERVLDLQRPLLEDVDGWEALGRWREAVVGVVAGLGCRGGCPVGSLADELAELDEQARTDAASIFGRWQELLVDALRAMVVAGQLRPDADLDRLALATVASLEGGLLLAKTTRTIVPVEAALDAAIAHLRTYAIDPPARTGSTRRRS
ncbi:MAG TPA: TetR family transcriptional regulator C-terminal domain-containing protein [Acidimicrobiales bacterium]|nr:TetR family transcriptional regulator C-terminal domain-containing protein [Acidimicrobiales bacterium]